MHIFCDESGGIGNGVMTFGAVHMASEEAESLLSRYRAITGLQGELKGSRIDLAERGLIAELFSKTSGQAHIAIMRRDRVSDAAFQRDRIDLEIYTLLLDAAVSPLILATGGCAEIVIDDGRYDPPLLEKVRQMIAQKVGQWGTARLVESHRSAGLQLADVIANSFFNIAVSAVNESANHRANRIADIWQPYLDSGKISLSYCTLD